VPAKHDFGAMFNVSAGCACFSGMIERGFIGQRHAG
jgi:hypothetical protein